MPKQVSEKQKQIIMDSDKENTECCIWKHISAYLLFIILVAIAYFICRQINTCYTTGNYWIRYILGTMFFLYLFPPIVWNSLSCSVAQDINIDPPRKLDSEETINKELWTEAIRKPVKGGEIIGHIERTAIFLACLLKVPTLIGAWLVFKAASKWDVWQNITKFPKELKHADQLDFLRARRQLGSLTNQSFIRGTLLNIVFAVITYLFTIGIWP